MKRPHQVLIVGGLPDGGGAEAALQAVNLGLVNRS